MLLIAAGLQSPALAVPSDVRDSRSLVNFHICVPGIALGIVMALGHYWCIDMAMG